MVEQEMLNTILITMSVIGVSIFLAMVIPIFIYVTKHTVTEDTDETKLAMFNRPIYHTKQKTTPELGSKDVDMESANEQAFKLDLMTLEAFRQMLKVSKKE